MDGELEISPPPEPLKIFENDPIPVKERKRRRNKKAMEEWKEKKKQIQEENEREQWIKKHPKWRWPILRQKLKDKMEEEEKKKKEEDEREKRIKSLANFKREKLEREQSLYGIYSGSNVTFVTAVRGQEINTKL